MTTYLRTTDFRQEPFLLQVGSQKNQDKISDFMTKNAFCFVSSNSYLILRAMIFHQEIPENLYTDSNPGWKAYVKGCGPLYLLISGTGISRAWHRCSPSPSSPSAPRCLVCCQEDHQQGQMASTGAQLRPHSAVLPPTSGFPESTTLTLLWSFAIFILFYHLWGIQPFHLC